MKTNNKRTPATNLAIARDRLFGVTHVATSLKEAQAMAEEALNLTGCMVEHKSKCPWCEQVFENGDDVYQHQWDNH